MKASMTWYEAQTPLGDTSRLKTNPLFRLEPVMWKFDPVNFGTVEMRASYAALGITTA